MSIVQKENGIIVGVMVVLILIFGLYIFLDSKKEKVNVYLFWGDGCKFCSNAKEFFNNDNTENSEYYNLVTYEVWIDEEGREKMEEAAEKLGIKVTGVPLIIIGDKHFTGYSSSMNDELNETIISCYESQDCIDIMKN